MKFNSAVGESIAGKILDKPSTMKYMLTVPRVLCKPKNKKSGLNPPPSPSIAVTFMADIDMRFPADFPVGSSALVSRQEGFPVPFCVEAPNTDVPAPKAPRLVAGVVDPNSPPPAAGAVVPKAPVAGAGVEPKSPLPVVDVEPKPPKTPAVGAGVGAPNTLPVVGAA